LAPGVTTLSYNGVVYSFLVSYNGGAGNDLVLLPPLAIDTKTQGN